MPRQITRIIKDSVRKNWMRRQTCACVLHLWSNLLYIFKKKTNLDIFKTSKRLVGKRGFRTKLYFVSASWTDLYSTTAPWVFSNLPLSGSQSVKSVFSHFWQIIWQQECKKNSSSGIRDGGFSFLNTPEQNIIYGFRSHFHCFQLISLIYITFGPCSLFVDNWVSLNWLLIIGLDCLVHHQQNVKKQ